MLAALGECGDRKCGNYRLNAGTCNVRPSFLEFCVKHIMALDVRDLVYCSVGSGRLLFDWELLERLRQDGVGFRAIQLVDKDYGPRGRTDAKDAQRTFAGWFHDFACPFRSFASVSDLEGWVKWSGEAAHVLLDCDAVGARKRIDAAAFRSAVLRTGGVCLVLSNPAKRTAIVKRGDLAVSSSLELVVQQHFNKSTGEWSERRPSTSPERKARKRSRGRSARRRSRERSRRRSRRRFRVAERCVEASCRDAGPRSSDSAEPPDRAEIGRATWRYLHTLASNFPEKPTPKEEADANSWLASFVQFYPCSHCAEGFVDICESMPPQTASRTQYVLWWCEAHNRVSTELGNDTRRCDLARLLAAGSNGDVLDDL